MIEKLPIAFAAGLISVVTPCVLPLVPGYLSAISAVEIDRLGDRGVGGGSPSRAFRSSSASRSSSFCSVPAPRPSAVRWTSRRSSKIAGFVLIVLGLAFMGLLPWPERAVAPGLLQHARRRRLESAARRCFRGVRGTVHRHGARIDPRPRVRVRARSRAASSCWSRIRSGSGQRSSSPASRSHMR